MQMAESGFSVSPLRHLWREIVSVLSVTILLIVVCFAWFFYFILVVLIEVYPFTDGNRTFLQDCLEPKFLQLVTALQRRFCSTTPARSWRSDLLLPTGFTIISWEGVMPGAFELFDTVVLKCAPKLIGTIDETSNDAEEPLDDDLLLVAYVDIPSGIIHQFVNSGRPPPGYYLVKLAEKYGYCLAGEDDITLLSRSFEVGDVVKSVDGSGKGLGTVVNLEEAYTLAPALLDSVEHLSAVSNRLSFAVNQTFASTSGNSGQYPLPGGIAHPYPHALLYNVPARELRRADDVLESDHIIYKDSVGAVEGVTSAAVLLTGDDSIVIVEDSEDFFLPIPEVEKPLVSFPEFSHIIRPDVLASKAGFSSVIPLTDLRPGQVILASETALRSGRWLRGSYKSKQKLACLVLDVRTHLVDVDWLACNAFTPDFITFPSPPSLHIYDNLSTFQTPRDLRSNKRKIIYDDERQPIRDPVYHPVIATEHSDNFSPQPRRRVLSAPKVKAGDSVRFRDYSGARVKYQDSKTTGRIRRLNYDPFMGFDLNEYRVICMSQQVEVLWQDGSCSTYPSTSLKSHTLFEADLGPGDVVVGREGMKQTEQPDTSVKKDFNEMTFFERGYELFPERVGIIQSVNPVERVAEIRWFENPEIVLTEFGYILSSVSRFGPISHEMEEVSLFEVMSFAGLTRRRKEYVTIPPLSFTPEALQALRDTQIVGSNAGIEAVSSFARWGGITDVGYHLRRVAKAQLRPIYDTLATTSPDIRADWFGEIVDIGTDGLLTVRLGACDPPRDVLVSYDMIIGVVDEKQVTEFDDERDEEWEDSLSDAELSAIAESISYEGGERLDNDSGDDNWFSEDEIEEKKDEDVARSTDEDQPSSFGGEDTVMEEAPTAPASPTHHANSTLSEFEVLKSMRPKSAPPAFAVLDREPPQNQFHLLETVPSSPAFLKRVNKELRILSTSLPEGEIYVRTYESRMDLLRCLVVGPKDTPYEYAPFIIDLSLGADFPRSPPTAHFHSWTSGLGRINPNLYEDGKICLSLLGTWSSKAETENWSEDATLLQLLVSLQGLVLVKKPFYNEAGYEDYEQEGAYTLESALYSEKAYVMARGFVKHALTNASHGCQGLEDVLAWLYLPRGLPGPAQGRIAGQELLAKVVERGQQLLERSEQSDDKEEWIDGAGQSDDATKTFLKPLSKGAMVMLRRTIQGLARLLEA